MTKRTRLVGSFWILLVAFMANTPILASSTCTNPDGVNGQILFNHDYSVPQVCADGDWVALGIVNPSAGNTGCTSPTGSKGTVLYNADHSTPQYCDGEGWVAMRGDRVVVAPPICSKPPLCPTVGDVCDDGNSSNDPDPKFAGFAIENGATCNPLYTTQSNQSNSIKWKNSYGTIDISASSNTDGRVNVANLNSGIANFPALQLCDNLSYGGFTDWYLPARLELDVLWMNKAAIGGFTNNEYWNSSEFSTSGAWALTFSGNGGAHFARTKNINHDVRCIRRD